MTQPTVVGRGSYDGPGCERCGSTTLQALSLVHQLGTATLALRSETIGVGLDTAGDIGMGGGVTQTHGVTQTILAARATPPSPASERWERTETVAIVTVIFTLVCWNQLRWFADLLLIAGTSVAGWVAFREIRRVDTYNLTQYPDLLRRWRTSALCLVCGHVQQLSMEPPL